MDIFGNIVNNGGYTEKYSIIIGTNFYATIIPTEDQIAEMQSALIKRQMKALQDMIANSSTTYHIGKRSAGWQFLFCPYIKIRKGFWDTGHVVSPWNNTLESIKEFLAREDVVIEDEYGRKYTSEQFWKEIGSCLYNDPEHYINGDQYYKNTGEQRILFDCPFEFTTEEGLRFSTCEDFS